MTMRIVGVGSGVDHVAPFERGPSVEVLVGDRADESGRLAVAQVTVPLGGSMPEHDHGDAEAVVVPQAGRLLLAGGDRREVLEPGTVAPIGVGERVSLFNEGTEPASLVAVFAPPGFVRSFAAWPVAKPGAG